MSVTTEYDGTVRIDTDEGIALQVPLSAILDNLDDEGMAAVTEHVADRIMDATVERLCGGTTFYCWPTDQRRAAKVLRAMEKRVLGTNLWGAFDATETAIRECILQDDRAERNLSYQVRSVLIDIAHDRAKRIRQVVHAEMAKLVDEVRGEEVQP